MEQWGGNPLYGSVGWEHCRDGCTWPGYFGQQNHGRVLALSRGRAEISLTATNLKLHLHLPASMQTSPVAPDSICLLQPVLNLKNSPSWSLGL